MSRAIAAMLVWVMMMSGCAKAPEIKNRPIYPRTTVGRFSKRDVDDLRAKIASLRFPLDHSVTKFLPPGFEPDHWAHYEPGFTSDHASVGWDGSMYVYDYWLNEDFILRIGTGTFPADGGPPTTKWAVIIPSSEQETYTKERHPHPKEPNQSPEPTSGTVTPHAGACGAAVPPAAHL